MRWSGLLKMKSPLRRKISHDEPWFRPAARLKPILRVGAR
jgi:hypothetical protein